MGVSPTGRKVKFPQVHRLYYLFVGITCIFNYLPDKRRGWNRLWGEGLGGLKEVLSLGVSPKSMLGV